MPVVPLPLIVVPNPSMLTLLLMLMVPFLFPELWMLMTPELILATQALAAAAMLVPVYFVEPSTLPVHVLPDTVTSPVAANRDVVPMASNDIALAAMMCFFILFGWL